MRADRPTSTVRTGLRSAVVDSAAPYGYALTIFATGSVADSIIGKPHIFEVLLYLGGAVIGFLAVELAAYGRLQVRLRKPAPPSEEIWGHAHIISAGVAVVACWAILRVISTDVGWLIVGCVATVLYLVLVAVQSTLASRAAD
ncbi:MAG TPA: hypothetical protein VHE08_04930 [Solirubrobacterales bacterium]|nr:hypothetical protein [Solirubrobacterales bacterium]